MRELNMDLEFRDLRYTVYNRFRTGRGREVVKGINGRFQSGQLVAILGPSGAGKTSLLNAVSGYKSAGVSGKLLLNGKERNEHEFKKYSCYITQENLLQPFLTVREAMDVAARLKLPKGTCSHAEDILQELGLLEHQHTRTDQLSGGQKKRLSIALELVNNPPVFFLDEPTSGLDIVTAVQCVKLLRQLSRQGRMVICTIHQPSTSLLEMFDQVYVIADGRCVFQGDTAALIPFFHEVGQPCPKHHNPSDFIIELTENPQNITALSEKVQNGKIYKSAELDNSQNESSEDVKVKVYSQIKDNVSEVELLLTHDNCTYKVQNCSDGSDTKSTTSDASQTMDLSSAWMKLQKTSESHGYPTTSREQFSILLHRMFIQIFRNRTGLCIQLIHHILCGGLVGTIFWNKANDGTQMFAHLKLCLGAVIFFTYTQLMVPVLLFPQDVKLAKKEHFNRWYSLNPYYAAVTVSRLPVQVALNILFCSIVYFVVGVPFTIKRFLAFCLSGNVVSLVAEGVGLAVGSVFNVRNGCVVAPSFVAPFLGIGVYGFDFARRIPLFLYLVMNTSFIRCGLAAFILTIFGFERKPLECNAEYCHFANPKVLIHYLDGEQMSVWIEISKMLAIMFVFRSVAYAGLRWRFST